VHFKGSGFYTTDYARKASAKASADGGAEAKGAKGAKDEAKSAASSSNKDD
jgi:predicted nucleic acid-binding Zn ribbon protein